jgi:hypothetical protein
VLVEISRLGNRLSIRSTCVGEEVVKISRLGNRLSIRSTCVGEEVVKIGRLGNRLQSTLVGDDRLEFSAAIRSIMARS